MLTLPDSLRDAFKDPLGPVTTDADELLAAAAETAAAHAEPTADDPTVSEAPIVAVGDVVTYHLCAAGRVPDVAVIDGKTEREAVGEEIEAALADPAVRRVAVRNPAASLSAELLSALATAVADDEPVWIEVTGEEDLATLPAILAAPDGASVVYGQPGEGMVRVPVTSETRAEARELFEALDGDVDAAYDALGVDPDDG
ncbi:GTP-dependent dephospho-CoA kinase family protein [Halorubrum sp. BV1]|uniref:GTP-dependent dephospho-CoA kinase family protein n=1 Tax=Halorubrum sp. BV1 TaxID=1498500 RepID=UPI00067945C7|nr:GTP-dependent dephospho-CoA kinase family protein [Halorubrum sp. BV1]